MRNRPETAIPPINHLNPGEIKIDPLLLLHAGGNLEGGAVRIWYVARMIDQEGSGCVSKASLMTALAELGVSSRAIQRWYRRALDILILKEVHRRSGSIDLVLTGAHKVANALGCRMLAAHPAAIQAASLLKPGWRALVWAAYLTSYEGVRVSRAELERLTGISERSQQYYERAVGIEANAQYAVDVESPADHLGGVQEFERSYAFPIQLGSGKTAIAYRLPNLYVVPPEKARLLPAGRQKKLQKKLDQLIDHSGSLIMAHPRAQAEAKRVYLRKYFVSEKAARQAVRRYLRKNPDAALPEFVLIPLENPGKRRHTGRSTLWRRLYVRSL